MKHAGFWRQVFAVLIDQAVIMLPSMIISGAYFYLAAGNGVDPTVAKVNSDLMTLALMVILSAAYYITFNGRYGVTLGRRLLKLKLTRLDEPNRDGVGYGRAARAHVAFVAAGGFVTWPRSP